MFSFDSFNFSKEFLDIFNRGLNPAEVTFVEDILRSRWIHDTSKQTYIDLVNEIGDFMIDNPNAEVPAELMAKAWNTQKVAFMAEANYDFFRNQWQSRRGTTNLVVYLRRQC